MDQILRYELNFLQIFELLHVLLWGNVPVHKQKGKQGSDLKFRWRESCHGLFNSVGQFYFEVVTPPSCSASTLSSAWISAISRRIQAAAVSTVSQQNLSSISRPKAWMTSSTVFVTERPFKFRVQRSLCCSGCVEVFTDVWAVSWRESAACGTISSSVSLLLLFLYRLEDPTKETVITDGPTQGFSGQYPSVLKFDRWKLYSMMIYQLVFI